MKETGLQKSQQGASFFLCLYKTWFHQPILLSQAAAAKRGGIAGEKQERYQHSVSNLPTLSNVPWSILSSTDTGKKIEVDSCTS